jgi:hypothetical protein
MPKITAYGQLAHVLWVARTFKVFETEPATEKVCREIVDHVWKINGQVQVLKMSINEELSKRKPSNEKYSELYSECENLRDERKNLAVRLTTILRNAIMRTKKEGIKMSDLYLTLDNARNSPELFDDPWWNKSL